MNKQTNKNLTGVQSLRQYYYSLQITLILFLYLITMLSVSHKRHPNSEGCILLTFTKGCVKFSSYFQLHAHLKLLINGWREP